MALKRLTLADQVAQEIVQEIQALELRPDDEIPSEGVLARRFGVNRLVVREAIRTLAAREILVSSQGRPARVRVPSARVFGQMLEFRLWQQSLSFEDLLDTRRVIEGELARRAALRVGANEASTGAARSLLARMADAVGDRDRFVDLDVAFHAAVARMAGGDMLRLVLSSLERILVLARRASYEGRVRRGQDHSGTLRAHATILDGIERGDPDAAAEAMAGHLAETEKDLR
ncbi:MAG: FadR/GntR family transcriptional regulator [Streptosporangiaceae bacterium]